MMSATSFLAAAPHVPSDPIFALTAQYNDDPSPQKVNLGQGTYRNAEGVPWVLPAVAAARERISEQGLYHEYLPILGLAAFRDAACKLVLGSSTPMLRQNQVRCRSC
jgi:aspartate aminotransferase, cytoplasmic